MCSLMWTQCIDMTIVYVPRVYVQGGQRWSAMMFCTHHVPVWQIRPHARSYLHLHSLSVLQHV